MRFNGEKLLGLGYRFTLGERRSGWFLPWFSHGL
jgi:hypothetical protein